MKLLIASVLVFGCAIVDVNAQDTQLRSQIDSVSYSIGVQIGKQIKSDTTMGLDVEILKAGISDAFYDRGMRLSDSQVTNVLQRFQMQMMVKEQENMDQQRQAGIRNRQEGEKFLAGNKRKAGVKTLPSGLQYEVVRPGTGARPRHTDQVRVLYRGTLLDGTGFDSALDPTTPAVFGVDQVIPGWTEGLQKMKVGSKCKLYIPADLGYGDNPPPGGMIKPGSLLIFEIELLGIER